MVAPRRADARGAPGERLPRARRDRSGRPRAARGDAPRSGKGAPRPADRRAERRSVDAPVVGCEARRGRRGVSAEAPITGVVLGGTGGVWRVRTAAGETVDATLRGRLK